MRLIRFVLPLTVTLSLIIFSSRRIGNLQSPSDVAIIFTNPDSSPCNVPCMFGIQPQKTNITEMLRITQNHPFFRSLKPTQTNDMGKYYYFDDKDQTVIIGLDGKDIVRSILWGNRSNRPVWSLTMADIILLLGNPSSISVPNKNISKVSYIYPNFHIEVTSAETTFGSFGGSALGETRLNPQDIVTEIFEYSPTTNIVSNWKRWQGFRPNSTYLVP